MLKFIKRLFPNSVKQEGKYFLYGLLKIPYSRAGVPLEILHWLPKGKPITFFDVGANAGFFSKSISGEYEISKAILVEPVVRLMPLLEKTFPDRDKFKIINAVLSDTISEVDFYVSEDADFVSSMLRIKNKGEEFGSLNFADPVLIKIKSLTLDSIVSDEKIDYVDLIKIDVQGAEHLVLQGGMETLKNTKLVYTEFSFRPVYDKSSVLFDLYNFFYDNGFMLAHLSSGFASSVGELLQGDALFVNRKFI
ncbi:MAG: FkbM family methyltransferase [Mucilaginibacter sp.]